MSVAVAIPAAVGLNLKLILVVSPGFRETGASAPFTNENWAPVIDTVLMDTAWVDGFTS